MSTIATAPRTKTEDDVTKEVLRAVRRHQRSASPPDYAEPGEASPCVRARRRTDGGEWFAGIEFLTAVGQKCSSNRQEFILLSDTLGLSIMVDLLSHRKPAGASETTLIGPFFRDGAPELPPGGDMATSDPTGQPVLLSGRVTGLDGTPIANALLDVWQSSSEGLYDSQMGEGEELHMRAKYRTDSDGRYLVRTTRPKHYPVPTDGPVGRMLEVTNRHPWRPPHVHFVISAPGYETLVTHIFDKAGKYLDSDTVFAVKDSLITEFAEQTTQDETAKRLGCRCRTPSCTTISC